MWVLCRDTNLQPNASDGATTTRRHKSAASNARAGSCSMKRSDGALMRTCPAILRIDLNHDVREIVTNLMQRQQGEARQR